jgi:hypothetical protein
VRDVGDSEDAHEDSEVGDEDSLEDKNSLKDEDGGLARRYQVVDERLFQCTSLRQVEDSEDGSCGDAETVWFAIVLLLCCPGRSNIAISQTSNRARN